MIEHRQALAEGRISASFGTGKKPAEMSDLEWIARSQRRDADNAERARRIERNQSRLLRGDTEHVEALEDSGVLMAERNATDRAFRQNAADIGLARPRIGTAGGKAADFFAAVLHADDDISSGANSPAKTAPERGRDKPTPPSAKH